MHKFSLRNLFVSIVHTLESSVNLIDATFWLYSYYMPLFPFPVGNFPYTFATVQTRYNNSIMFRDLKGIIEPSTDVRNILR
jgi:hypothetical protein